MSTEHHRRQKFAVPSDNTSDLDLARGVSNGSIEAWHHFVDRYSGLIYTVVRRHLFTQHEDEVRTVFVDILKTLYDGDIEKYRGESSFATWLAVFARGRTVDYFRKRYGRFRTPDHFDELNDFDKKVHRFFHVERLPIPIVIHMLEWSGHSADVDTLIDSIQRIEDRLDPRYLRRLDIQHMADASGVDSVRVLEYLIELRREFEIKTSQDLPDAGLAKREVQDTIERIGTAVEQLSAEERKVIFFRFNRRWSAKKIAVKMGLNGQRRVYTIIDRVIRRLRRAAGTDWEL